MITIREILFRGKEICTNKWVYGYLLADTADCSLKKEEKCSCAHDGSICWILEWDDAFHEYVEKEVIPETVGQYTGLNDKNGKKIFEGDIVTYATLDNFQCFSVVKFGEYEQDGSGGKHRASKCFGWHVEVDDFTCPDWAENDPTYFNDFLKTQSILEVNQVCEVFGNIHDDPDFLRGADF